MKHQFGLKFRKFDLHIHTPASSDYKDMSATAEEIVDKALAMNLAGIAITDHQTGRWVDDVMTIGKRKGLVVFPGVEIKATGGQSGVHLNILFDVDKNSEHIKQFLNTIEVYEQKGVADLISNKSVPDILRALQKFDSTAIVCLAHCHSSQGVTSEMRGEQRSEIFKPEFVSLLGAEANETDFKNEDRKKKRTRIVDLFDGHSTTLHNKKLGVYQASDSHSLDTIGRTPTYFKVDNNITIEDLRQCFINGDSRIRQVFEFKEFSMPFITSLSVNQGFLDEQIFDFHNGLNCLLGGKGSGKSLTIEFLRFCLNQPPLDEALRYDHDSKLEVCLKPFGQVTVIIQDESGKQFEIKRDYDFGSGNPLLIVDKSDGQEKSFAVEEIFPVLFLSQNEIVKIAEDRTGASTRKFIDRFFDFRKYHREIQTLSFDLQLIDQQFADAIRAHTKGKLAENSINILKEEIDKLDRLLNNEVFEKYKEAEKIDTELQGQINSISSISSFIKTHRNEFQEILSLEESDSQNPLIKRMLAKFNEASNLSITRLDSLIDELEKINIEAGQIQVEWQNKFGIIRKSYLETVSEAGSDQISINRNRQEKMQRLNREEDNLKVHKTKSSKISEIAGGRDKIINKLENVYKDYSNERKQKCQHFTDLSEGSLRVTISEGADTSEFLNNLSKLKTGSHIRVEDIALITENMRPAEFIKPILRFEYTGRKARKELEGISEKSGLKIETVEKLVLHLLNNCTLEDILGLQYDSIPEDVPKIEYKVSGVFKELSTLSVGQKATSFLLIALSEGTFPIVIDQPEDSLDLRTIWDDVCKKIRGAKDLRQFILTTHNSSVAVASDTDKFTIVVADATKGEILFSGSMNSPDIKKEVIDYVEGGMNTYQLKKSNYNI
jgi:hypothetical protein